MFLEVENSPQYNDLTTPDNGRNIRVVLQALSHFFLEDNDFTQTAENSFGPTSETEFRTTSKVTFSGTKKVYAVCQGEVFIQPQTGNNDKVNIILRPYKQPINSISIKYFIYRGLNKSDFFEEVQYQGNNRLKITGSETTGIGFVKYIWAEFNRFYNEIDEEKPVFLEEFIGFPASAESQNLTDLIDSYFYKIARYDEETGEEIEGGTYELPLVPRGMHLGNATGEIGFDVVLNTGDYYIENDPNPYQLNLAFVRAAEGVLDTVDGTSDFQKKLIRESCTWFIDPVAFYGIHANGHGKLYVGENNTTPLTSKEEIYAQIEEFHTKNTIYLYIQSNRQRSYNFYGNYVLSETNSNNIETGTSEGSMTETTFGTLGWPVHRINNINNVENQDIQLTIQLINKGIVYNPSFYCLYGDLVSDNINGFIDKYSLSSLEVTEYSNSIIFSLKLTQVNSYFELISGLIYIYYETENINYEYLNGLPSYNKKLHIIFNKLFNKINVLPFFRNDGNLRQTTINNYYIASYNTFSDSISINQNKILYNIGKKVSDPPSPNSDYTYENRIMLVAKKNSDNSEVNYSDQTFLNSTILSKRLKDETNKLSEIYYEGMFDDKNYFLHSYLIKDSNDDEIKLLQLLNNQTNQIPFFCLGITQTEYDQLIAMLPQDASNLSFCSNQNINELNTDSLNEFVYYKFYLGIIYEDSAGLIQVAFPIIPIEVYSLNLTFFASKSYSEYEFYAIDAGSGSKLI